MNERQKRSRIKEFGLALGTTLGPDKISHEEAIRFQAEGSIEITIQKSIRGIAPKWKRVINVVACLYIVSWILFLTMGVPTPSILLLRTLTGYYPITWLVGLIGGLAITYFYDSVLSDEAQIRSERMRERMGEKRVGRIVKGLFFLALGLLVIEIILQFLPGNPTISRWVFDLAQHNLWLYEAAGAATGAMVMIALLGAKLNPLYRLSVIVLIMVSAHIYWHLGFEAYAEASEVVAASENLVQNGAD